MKTRITPLVLAALTLAFCSQSRADESVAGKWKGEFDSQVGMQKYTFEFKVDGDKVTGKAVGVRDEATNNVEILEGKISKDEITFVEPLKIQDNEIRIEYKGKISGDEIKFHRQVGDFGSEDFVAKRVKDSDMKSDMKMDDTKTTTKAPAAKP